MTETEKEVLRALGRELAEVQQSPWQPACIASAFATNPDRPALTMQGWIDLDALHSPLLAGDLPETVEEVKAALEAFGIDDKRLTPDVMMQMLEAVKSAFALALPMVAPDAAEAGSVTDDGFGSWLPLFACLVTQCGLSPEAALRLRVDRAFALVAAMRRNQGWQPGGTPYALREILNGGGVDADATGDMEVAQ